MNYFKKYLKYKQKYLELQAKYNQTGGWYMLRDKNYYISNKEKNTLSFETKFVIKYKDFLNQEIFQALNLSTAYFEDYATKLGWSNPNRSELYEDMVKGVTSYLSAMSHTPVEPGDLSLDKDIYIYIVNFNSELLKKFLSIQTSDKSFKLSGKKYIWDSNTVSK